MMGRGTTAIIELSVHSLPVQWVDSAGRGRPVSFTKTSVVRAVQPLSRSTAAAVIRGANRERTLHVPRMRNLLCLPVRHPGHARWGRRRDSIGKITIPGSPEDVPA